MGKDSEVFVIERLSGYGLVIGRVLISLVFLLNAAGIIDQTIPAKEMAEHGVPPNLVPAIMLVGRALELLAGVALALGLYPRLAALALFAFLVPATFISHSFWLALGTKQLQPQLINFSKNVAIWGGLLFVAASSTTHRVTSERDAHSRNAFSGVAGGETRL
jgi:uncharacterized membrane protein YphA (DoxX/SURF4 family)